MTKRRFEWLTRWLSNSGSAGSRTSESQNLVAQRKRYVVDRKHALVYAPIEKNACTFIKRTLLKHSDLASDFAKARVDVHRFVKEREEFRFDPHEHLVDSGLVWFAIVREPIERTVSAYLNKFVRNTDYEPASRATQAFRGNVSNTQSLLTFAEFVELVCATDDEGLDHHWRSQSWFLAADRQRFHHLVPFSQIHAFLPLLEAKIGAAVDPMPTRNKTEYGSFELSDEWYNASVEKLRALEQMPAIDALVTPSMHERLSQRFEADRLLYEEALKQFQS